MQTLPACRHPPALFYQPLLEGSSNPLTRLPASPGRELRPPDSFTSLSWKGAMTPWSHLPASLGRELQPPDWRLQPSTPPWTTFHQFSHWIQQLQKSTTCRPRFIIFSDWTLSIHLSTVKHQQQIAKTQQIRSDIPYPILQQTLVCIRAFLSLMSRIYALPSTSTSVYLCINFTTHTCFIFSKAAYIRTSSVAN